MESKQTIQDDVKRFLEDLDTLTGPPVQPKTPTRPSPTTAAPKTDAFKTVTAAGPGMSRPPKTSTNSKDILSFLDEIDASPAVTASTTAALPGTTPPAAMQSAVPPKPKPMAAATATLHLPRPPTASLSPPTSITAASPSNNSPSDAICAPASSHLPSAGDQSRPGLSQPPAMDTRMDIPMDPQMGSQMHPHTDPQMTPNNWSWGTIWSSAATATAKGLENMQAMAEQTAHAVSSNDKVRGLYAGVAPEIGRIGTDLSNLAKISANTIADTIAPPLVRGGLHGGPAGASFSSTIHVWFCADVPDPVVLEQLHNFVQTTLEEMWMKPFLPADSKTGAPLSANANPRIIQICDRVAVNSIQNPDPVVVKSLSEALAHSDVIIARLQTLSESHQSSASAHAENTHKPEGQDEAGPERACFLCVQPFSTILAPSQLFDATKHTQYLVTMVCDAGDLGVISPLTISQSVAACNPSTQSEPHWAAWEQTLHRRVIETAIADLCEEFVVSVRF